MSNKEDAILSVQQVTKSYGPLKALDGVTLEVDRGEFVALLGPNGAGKTTLFQLLTGLFVADGGAIRVSGHDIRNSPVPALAGIGVVFQQPTLDLDLSVGANLRFHGRLHDMRGNHLQARIEAELERLGLTERARDKARQLSGGTRRRVELARALLHEPEVLLMDEPTVGLDPATRRDLLAYVHRLCAERGLGVLWATHLVEEAEGADRVVILYRGHVLKDGPPAVLVKEAGLPSLADTFLSITGAERDSRAAS